MRAVILGLGSDIARNLAQRLIIDGWEVDGTTRGTCDFASNESIDRAVGGIARPWDLLIVAVGNLVPVGKFTAIHPDDWAQSIQINALGPLRMFHHLIPHRNKDAAAVFFSGTNPGKVNPGYSAYSASKAMLARAVQEINAELDIKAFTLAPGFVQTKIHDATVKAGVKNDRLAIGGGTSHETIYKCLQHLLTRPKAEVGGKSIYVPSWADVWKEE